MSDSFKWLEEFFRLAHEECSRGEWRTHKFGDDFRVDISELFHVAALRGFQKHCKEFIPNDDLKCWKRYTKKVSEYVNLVRQDGDLSKRLAVYKILRGSCASVHIGRAASWAYFAGLHLERTLGLNNLYWDGSRKNILSMLEWAGKHPTQRGDFVLPSGRRIRYKSPESLSEIELETFSRVCDLVKETSGFGGTGAVKVLGDDPDESSEVMYRSLFNFVEMAAIHVVSKYESMREWPESFRSEWNRYFTELSGDRAHELSIRMMDWLSRNVEDQIKDAGLSIWQPMPLEDCWSIVSWARTPWDYRGELKIWSQNGIQIPGGESHGR